MGLPPWETSDSQLFALITGANSGLGFGIATRLIDEFLTSPSTPSNKHLVLIIVTRSPLKTRFALSRLRAHLRGLAEYSSYATKQRKKAKDQGVEYKWQTTVKRVHFLGVEVDLCDLKSVYALADKLLNGTLGTPDATTYDGLKLPAGSPGTQGYSKDIQQDRWALSERDGSSGHMRSWGWGLSGIRIPRLDVVVWNAGIGGWIGMDWPAAVWTVLTDIKEATTWPAYKIANVGAVVKSQLGLPDSAKSADGEEKQPLLNDEKGTEPPLGEVFCANVFGHYTLAHELMPLLSRPATPTSKSGGKIIWVSSIEALPEQFSVDDIQGLKSEAPYESGKRLVDILALSADLPSTQNVSKTFFECSNKATPEEKENGAGETVTLVKPKVYVVHPGVFASEIMPLAWILVRFMEIAFYLARWLGSPWHAIVPYKAAVAPVWLALAGEETLDRMNGTRSKWGSATDRWGEERVRKTEVGGWGWDGKIGSLEGRDDGEGVVEQRSGRQRHAVDITKEAREDFEIQGAKSWREMEVLRIQWKKLLGFEDKN